MFLVAFGDGSAYTFQLLKKKKKKKEVVFLKEMGRVTG